MIDISNDLCGTVKADGETLKVVKVGVRHVLTTQDEPTNIKQCSCGGFYLDEDCFTVVNHTITKAGKAAVDCGFTTCGGVSWDGAVFKMDGTVLSLIPEPATPPKEPETGGDDKKDETDDTKNDES